MPVKNQNQIRKDLVKRMKIIKEAKKQERIDIENLPETEKLALDIDILKGYINRYKNDLSNGIIKHKVDIYKNQLKEKEERLLQLSIKKEEPVNDKVGI